jgi:hypothetical protein
MEHRAEEKGKRTEGRGQKTAEEFSCGSGFQPRSYDLNDLNDQPTAGSR